MKTTKPQTYLEISIVLLVTILQVVWPLPDTIAIRNFCLIGGGVCSLVLITFHYNKLEVKKNLPVLLLIAVPIWLLIHYIFIPVDLKKQWYYLSGTWLRIFLGILISISLGGILASKPHLFKLIYFPYVAMSCVTLVLFLMKAFNHQEFVVLGFTSFFKTKIALAYFTVFTCLISCALLINIINKHSYL